MHSCNLRLEVLSFTSAGGEKSVAPSPIVAWIRPALRIEALDPRRASRLGYNRLMNAPSNDRRQWGVILLLGLLAFGGGVYLATRSAPPSGTPDIPGLLWPDPPMVGAFELKDADGRPFSQAQILGKWSFLFFGFTHCPDVCPTTLATLKTVDASLRSDPVYQARGQMVFVSVDPERDDAKTLKEYIAYFNPAFKAVTGTDAGLRQLTGALGVLYAKVDTNAPDGYSIDHTASIFLLDPQGRLVALFSLPHDARQIVDGFHAINRFIESQS